MTRKKWITCPQCGRRGQSPYTSHRPQVNVRVRYFKCPGCQYKFKTRERVDLPKPGANGHHLSK